MKENLDWQISFLFVLASLGDVNLFEYWLNKKNLNIDLQDDVGDTALHYAVKGGHIALVIFLLQNKVCVEAH